MRHHLLEDKRKTAGTLTLIRFIGFLSLPLSKDEPVYTPILSPFATGFPLRPELEQAALAAAILSPKPQTLNPKPPKP